MDGNIFKFRKGTYQMLFFKDMYDIKIVNEISMDFKM